MATDPECNSDTLVAGLRFLLGETPDVRAFAAACHQVLGMQVYPLMHQLEDWSDVIKPITIDVDDVIDDVDDSDDIQWSAKVDAMSVEDRKAFLRGLMNDIRDWYHVSKRKFELQDDFIKYLKEEDVGAVVDAAPEAAEEADAATA